MLVRPEVDNSSYDIKFQPFSTHTELENDKSYRTYSYPMFKY